MGRSMLRPYKLEACLDRRSELKPGEGRSVLSVPQPDLAKALLLQHGDRVGACSVLEVQLG
jgi:hypothetical protein